ncbi:uncharacterized FAD-linked oxidoreductase ARB_02478 [Selaginella moellendorffii]|uniref:uncharacterized FAD-linked oxidoreductase ARB_02478 n=1 Tax=Selaginella moellendorffii TaxID=88036 RepID=UPI000D1D123D|nr:uncharacterized FAD-linked oxidoreductase ARB_02478 [Selaginella moellendorffii]|eukprot:XP_002981361.2 uncharacterized FAD-linked oxidoreductase ARB_02478 [Selaginella moellendorffii]
MSPPVSCSSIAILALILLVADARSSLDHDCLCTAFQSSCWPDPSAWDTFNSSIDGRLIEVLPPAAPCHESHFDEQACQIVREKWSSPFWRSDQPGAMQASNWEASGDQSCLISSPRNSSCSQGSVPVYAVNVSTPSHVQSAVKFASAKNIRLVIKNTGHDFFGKSTAAGSLSIWTHHMKNMSFHHDFVAKRCSVSPVSAVTVGAGVQWEELYQAVFKQGKVIVGAGGVTVGAAGGYPQAAGHSPISPAFGLAADNVLEYEVVTAAGDLVVANGCQNKELFWALRGGGGGTFGVVVSATHRTHPPLTNLAFAVYTINATDRSSFLDLLTNFAVIHPSLSEAGWSGYFLLSSQSLQLSRQTLLVLYILPNKDVSFAKSTLAPFLDYVEKHPKLQGNGSVVSLSSFQEYYSQFLCGGQNSCVNSNGSASPGALSSRLIPKSLFDSRKSVEQLSDALISILERYPASILGAFVAGGAVARPRDENAVNPAWRRALLLAIISSGWSDGASLEEQREVARNVSAANKLLIDLTPGSGTYINEADFNEPDWQQSFFGEHYPRLQAIKSKVDPSGLFRCHHCVGSEKWSDDLNCPRSSE